MHTRILMTAVWTVAWWTGGAGVNAQDAQPRAVELKAPCIAFALNPRTGDVIGLAPSANTATLYPQAYLDGKNQTIVGPVATGAYPVAVVFKAWKDKTYFVVGCFRQNRIDVFDAKTLKAVGQIAIKPSDVSWLTTSRQLQDPCVYYAHGRGHDSKVGRIRVDDLRDEGDLDLNDSVMDMEISADGNFLYTRGPWSPSGFRALRAVRDASGETRWTQTFYDHTSVAPYLPDPFGIYTGVGRLLCTADLSRQVREFDQPLAAFFPDRPVIVSVSAGRDMEDQEDAKGLQVTAISYNDFRVLGRASVPEDAGKKKDLPLPEADGRYGQGDFKRIGYRVQVLADPVGNRVLVAVGARVGIVPLVALSVKDEPLLVASVEPPPVLKVGEPVEVPVTPLDKRVDVSLKDAPKGVRLADGKIAWTPADTQVGHATVILRLKNGGLQRDQVVEFDVVQRCIQLGFTPSRIEISPDGKRAVAWSQPGRGQWRDEGQGLQRSRMALIDVENRKVLVEKELLYAVTAAAVDTQFVYVAPSDSDRVNALDHKELTRQKHSLTEGRVEEIWVLSPKLLACQTQKGLETFSLPDLALTRTALTPMKRAQGEREAFRDEGMLDEWGRPRAGGRLTRLNDGWYGAGTLFSADMTATRMLVMAQGLPTLEVQRQTQPQGRLPWQRYLRENALMSLSGRQIVMLDVGAKCILADVPAVAVLSVSGWDQPTVTARLTIRDVVSGETAWQVNLLEEPVAGMTDERRAALAALGGEWGRGGGEGVLTSAGRTLLATVADRVFVLSLSDELIKKCPPPFEFQPLSDTPVIDPAKNNTIPLAMRGGQAPFEFELAMTHDGVSIDAKTGTLTVDGPGLFKAASELVLNTLGRGAGDEGGRPDMAATPRQQITALAQQTKERYKQLTGRDAKGIPVLLPVGVAASDRNQQIASMECQVVVEVPETRLVGELAQAEQRAKTERDAQQQEYERERKEEERRMAELEKRRRDEAKTATGTDERIRALEERVRTLETKIDTLIQLLGERKGQPKPAPEKDKKPE